ncbi:hypothetical protein PVAP13_9KG078140 [Panicum virgatum]|uniref:Uncharacterized protein n=1 Tax=Panicum virgatum TaxID=38727 RepID=A0A8T0ND15_PANVG|nr:hypothetical protein PVAP13_9KG078140 [Panicum virgatum]
MRSNHSSSPAHHSSSLAQFQFIPPPFSLRAHASPYPRGRRTAPAIQARQRQVHTRIIAPSRPSPSAPNPHAQTRPALVRRASQIQPRTHQQTNPFSFAPTRNRRGSPALATLSLLTGISTECVNKPTTKSPSPPPAPHSPIRSRGSRPLPPPPPPLAATAFAPRQRGAREMAP